MSVLKHLMTGTWMCFAVACLFACGEKGGDSPGKFSPDAQPKDVSILSDEGVPQTDALYAEDIQEGEDAELVLPDVPSIPLFGTPCEGNQDCPSDGLCVEGPDGFLCTQLCLDSCPEGWACKGISGGADVVFVCVPQEEAACAPCSAAKDCASPTECVEDIQTFGDVADGTCALPCTGVAGYCPGGFSCQQKKLLGGKAIWACAPLEGGCCAEATLDAEEDCNNSNEYGACSGRRRCDGKLGWSPCDGAIPQTESCDRLDNDCDDEVDEDLGELCSCGDGVCQETGGETVQSCPYDCKACGDGECSPSESPIICPEDCCGQGGSFGCGDGLCQGYACGEDPESCPVDCGTPCGNEVCEAGETPLSCEVDCAWQVCGNAICEPGDGGPQFCPQDCATTCGNCVCEGGEDWLTCPSDCGFCGDNTCSSCNQLGENAQSCAADCCGGTEELCGGGDEDCDGAIDEGFELLGAPCDSENDDDECDENGAWICNGDNLGLTCLITGPQIEEECDGLDNDCDKKIDEDFPLLGTACDSDDLDDCANGYWVCGQKTGELKCDGDKSGSETCDLSLNVKELDEDCDGLTDEDDALGCTEYFQDVDEDGYGDSTAATRCLCGPDLASFYTSEIGGDCEKLNPGISPGQVDVCDGIDNDCDPFIDEGHLETVSECGLGACISSGVLSCYGGVIVDSCEALETPQQDSSCDLKDQDCDGVVDEHFETYVSSCGVGACLALGQVVCVGGFELNDCEALVLTAGEVCDGEDNDCNGLIDDVAGEACNFPPVPTAQQSFEVNVNAVLGAPIGAITATDPEDDTLVFSPIAWPALFALSSNGQITVAQTMNSSDLDSYNLFVNVADAGDPVQFAITIDVVSPLSIEADYVSVTGASGNQGIFVPGDTMKVVWDNSKTGNANALLVQSFEMALPGIDGPSLGTDNGQGCDALDGDNQWTLCVNISEGMVDSEGQAVDGDIPAIFSVESKFESQQLELSIPIDAKSPSIQPANISVEPGTGTHNGNAQPYILGDELKVKVSTEGESIFDEDVVGVTVFISSVAAGLSENVIASDDGGACDKLPNDNEWTACFVPGTLEIEDVTLSVTVLDDAGNHSSSADDSTLSIDTMPPEQPTIPDVNAVIQSGNTYSITVNFHGCPQGASQMWLKLASDTGSMFGPALGVSCSSEFIHTWTKKTAGAYTVWSVADDVSGNSVDSEVLSFSVPLGEELTSPAVDMSPTYDLGASNSDNITPHPAPKFIVGGCQPGATVYLTMRGLDETTPEPVGNAFCDNSTAALISPENPLNIGSYWAGAYQATDTAEGDVGDELQIEIAPRFTDQTIYILDEVTDATWSTTLANGGQAVSYKNLKTECESTQINGKMGRVPTIDELRSLIYGCPASNDFGECPLRADPECLTTDCDDNDTCSGCEESGVDCYFVGQGFNKLNCTHFDGNTKIWSSSTVNGIGSGLNLHWAVDFTDGSFSAEDKAVSWNMRGLCVR